MDEKELKKHGIYMMGDKVLVECGNYREKYLCGGCPAHWWEDDGGQHCALRFNMDKCRRIMVDLEDLKKHWLERVDNSELADKLLDTSMLLDKIRGLVGEDKQLIDDSKNLARNALNSRQ